MGILRTPERLYQEHLDLQMDEENPQQEEEENNYDGKTAFHPLYNCLLL